jgi:DNA-binding NarL/FixJ family response regulator
MNNLATEDDAIALSLTPRQTQVLKLICHRGLSNKAIGNILKISESTVKIHTSAILRRYGVKNRTQLVLAYSNNLRA